MLLIIIGRVMIFKCMRQIMKMLMKITIKPQLQIKTMKMHILEWHLAKNNSVNIKKL